jgi:nitrite reductase/ring-hydroxylating ferredoxin subunit
MLAVGFCISSIFFSDIFLHQVFRFKDQIYAIDGKCAHQGGPLWNGDVEDLGQQHAAGHVCISCPWHRWTFSLQTGNSVSPAGHSLEVYRTRVEIDGRISVAFSTIGTSLFESCDF